MVSLLILDLDDTIFLTKSIEPSLFDPAFGIIKSYYDQGKSNYLLDELTSALWTKPIDVVFTTYRTPENVISEFYSQIRKIDFSALKINPFKDYEELKSLPQTKILVTTGFEELQAGKINALDIASDFDSIFIDDPQYKPRRHKLDIFKQILIDTSLPPHQICVIGDNPDSEIKAGHQLGMKTIQRRSESKEISGVADHVIESFEELNIILNL